MAEVSSCHYSPLTSPDPDSGCTQVYYALLKMAGKQLYKNVHHEILLIYRIKWEDLIRMLATMHRRHRCNWSNFLIPATDIIPHICAETCTSQVETIWRKKTSTIPTISPYPKPQQLCKWQPWHQGRKVTINVSSWPGIEMHGTKHIQTRICISCKDEWQNGVGTLGG